MKQIPGQRSGMEMQAELRALSSELGDRLGEAGRLEFAEQNVREAGIP